MSVEKFGRLPRTGVHTDKNHIEDFILRLNQLKSSVNDDINAIIRIISTAIKSKIVAKFSENNLFKLEVIAYMRLLIDKMLEKTKNVVYEAKKDRTGDSGSANGDSERKGGEEGERTKAYVDSTIRDSETSMRTYMDTLDGDSEAAMRTHYTDNTNAEMGKIVEKINSVHYAVERDINGIIANIIPSVVKTIVLELVRENDMLIADLKTRFDSFTPQMMNIQREILTKIPNSIKITIDESTKEWNTHHRRFKSTIV
ncbi:hypothetical protein FQA39_LY17064 [Lamprigera yunnana]|nr:hypothetical protein FQA39_LY17064 [Lamprigera yunnana]